jgi:hypothetical protein
MRRWNLLSLVALLVMALIAAVVITSREALAAPSSLMRLPATSTTFKGKVVAKNSDTNYFVFTFTCAPQARGATSTLIGNWTYEVSSTQSFTGTTTGMPVVAAPTCSLTNGSYSTTQIPLYFNGMPVTTISPTGVHGPQAMLLLSLTNIVASKTFFGTFVSSTTGDCTSSVPGSPCVAVQTLVSDDDMLVIPTVSSSTTVPSFSLMSTSFSTLNLSAQ